MKKVLLIFLSVLTIFFAEAQTNDLIEGKWVSEMYPNTMYQFENGLRYTYYCSSTLACDSTYWNSLDTFDALPGVNPYTFDGDSLIIDLGFGNFFEEAVTFECEGKVVNFNSQQSNLYRVGTILSDCNLTGINEDLLVSQERKLIKVMDVLGRETKVANNEVLIYIYDDGTVEKKMILE